MANWERNNKKFAVIQPISLTNLGDSCGHRLLSIFPSRMLSNSVASNLGNIWPSPVEGHLRVTYVKNICLPGSSRFDAIDVTLKASLAIGSRVTETSRQRELTTWKYEEGFRSQASNAFCCETVRIRTVGTIPTEINTAWNTERFY